VGTPAPAAPSQESPALAPTPLNAILTKIAGAVKVNGKLVTRPVLLKENQVVETEEGGSASIFFGRDGIVHLAGDAKVTINLLSLEKRANGIDLDHGKARVLVRSGGPSRSFTVRTRTATMGVRGTHILIDVPKDLSLPPRFVTFEGKAEVRPNLPPGMVIPNGKTPPPAPPAIVLAKQETVSVSAGSGSSSSGNAGGSGSSSTSKPEPRKMDATETQKLVSEVAPPREIRTPTDVKTVQLPREGGPGERPTGSGPSGPTPPQPPPPPPRPDRGSQAGGSELLPGFGFGMNGGFGFTGGGTLLGQTGTQGNAPALDPVADGAGVARITIHLSRP